MISQRRASSFLLVVFFFSNFFEATRWRKWRVFGRISLLAAGQECARETVFLRAAADTHAHGNFIMKIRAYAAGCRGEATRRENIFPWETKRWWPGKRTAAVAIRNAADIRWEEGRGEISRTTRRAKFHNVGPRPRKFTAFAIFHRNECRRDSYLWSADFA